MYIRLGKTPVDYNNVLLYEVQYGDRRRNVTPQNVRRKRTDARRFAQDREETCGATQQCHASTLLLEGPHVLLDCWDGYVGPDIQEHEA